MTARHVVRRMLALAALSAACLVVAPAAWATNYVCDCGTGSDSDCVAGSDNNPGTFPGTPKRTYEAARAAFSSLPAGGETLFCRGGSFGSSSVSSRWDNRNCTEGNRCVISDYDAPWGSGDEERPIIRQSIAGKVGFSFSNGGNAVHTGNVLLSNLDMRGDGTPGADAIFFFNDANNYEIRNMRIDSWKIGIHAASSTSCSSSSPECNGANDAIFVYDSVITNNTNQGWLGRASNGGIYNSYWEGNGAFVTLDHNIYYSNGDNFVISGNQLYRSARGGGDRCGGTSLTVHGTVNNLLIENNEIWEDIGEATPACWGMGIDNGYSSAEAMRNVTIRGNTVRNMGNVAIGVAACANCVIENNIIIAEQSGYSVNAITAPNRSPGPGDIDTTEITVRNNSIYVGPQTNGGTGVRVGSMGNQHTITSNAIYYGGSGNFNCLAVNSNTNVYRAVRNNVCYYPNSSNADWAENIGSLSSWQSLGLGQSSQNADPQFRNPGSGDFTAASSSARIVGAGAGSLSSPLAFGGGDRSGGGTPDAGAWEFGVAPTDTSTPPSPPTEPDDPQTLAAPYLLE